MKRIPSWTSKKSVLLLGLLLFASVWGATWLRSSSTAEPDAAMKARLSEAYGQLPLSFEANVGQTAPEVDFISRGSGYTLFLKPREAVLALRKRDASDGATVLRMKFAGSETKPQAAGQEELPGKVNYLIGKDPKQWRTGISTYAKVAYQNLYPGVDLVYYGNQRQLEYDFVVQPGTDPNIIALNFEGAEELKVDAKGELVLNAGGDEIRQRKPVIYQNVDGARREVAGGYKLKDASTVGFQLGEYDASKPLVIDPVLVYSTFLGGANVDLGSDITVDASGNAYVVGTTQLLILPGTFPTTAGAFDTTHNGILDAFVTKINSTGTALVYSTFLGGSDLDSAAAIALDAAGNAYVTGSTSSTDFPTTAGAFDTTHNSLPGSDAFVTKLNASGSALVYSTYLGGFEQDAGAGIAVDAAGNAYVGGDTRSSSFPTTPGAFDPVHNGGEESEIFVTKVNPTGTALVYSTFIGLSSGGSLALDSSGSAYVTGGGSAAYPTTPGAFDTTHNGGSDVVLTKLDPSGSALVYSTFIGGSGNEDGNGIALDASGNAYVTGSTTSTDYPTTVGALDTTYNGGFSDAFVTKLNPAGSAPLVYSTFLGDVDTDRGNDLAVDTSGNVYLTGSTGSPNFPTTADAFDTSFNGGPTDVVVAKLNPSGAALVYSTFLGGSGREGETGISDDEGLGIAVDTAGSFYVTGATRSANFPTTAGAFDTTHNGVSDAFVTKFSEAVVSTAGCEITTGGWIIAANGDRANFGGHAKVNESGDTEGNLSYVDHGPAQRLNVHSISVQMIVCEGSSASISGQASINGSDLVNFTINLQDLGKGSDTYQLIIDDYDSGEQVLGGGNIQIRQK
jgi:hypothetical protein